MAVANTLLRLVHVTDRAFTEIKRKGHISEDTAQDYRIARQAALEEAAMLDVDKSGQVTKPEDHAKHKMSAD